MLMLPVAREQWCSPNMTSQILVCGVFGIIWWRGGGAKNQMDLFPVLTSFTRLKAVMFSMCWIYRDSSLSLIGYEAVGVTVCMSSDQCISRGITQQPEQQSANFKIKNCMYLILTAGTK